MGSKNERSRPTVIEVTGVIGTLLGVAAAIVAVVFTASSVEVSKDALEASERSFEARSQPLLQEIPRGETLARPEFIAFGRDPRPTRVTYEGQVVVGTVGPHDFDRVSIPIRNVGPGTAVLTRARLLAVIMDVGVQLRPAGRTYVEPGGTARVSAQGFDLPSFGEAPRIDPSFRIELDYTDFARDTRWRTRITYLVVSGARPHFWTPGRPSQTVRLSSANE